MDPFRLTLDDLTFVGTGLNRPESVLPTRNGDVYTACSDGGISVLRADGSQGFFGRKEHADNGFVPNGFALMPDGSFLIANIGKDGGVWRLTRDGELTPWLMEVDGVAFGMPNFVYLDHFGRVWVNGLPRRLQGTYSPGSNEGIFVLVDDKGARIVADGVDVPNELRIDPVRGYIYTNETFLARTIRFKLADDGTMTDRETVLEYDRTDHVDGFNIDAEGHIWTTSVVVNRIYRGNPDTGETIKVFEEQDDAWTARAAEAVETGTFNRAILYEDHGLTCRNLSSLSFGGPDLRTVYVGQLAGSSLVSFRAPVAGLEQAHWNLGPF